MILPVSTILDNWTRISFPFLERQILVVVDDLRDIAGGRARRRRSGARGAAAIGRASGLRRRGGAARRGSGILVDRGLVVATGRGAILPARQNNHVAGDHLGAVAILPGLLILPLVGAQPALDIHTRALGEILIADVAELIPGYAAEPLGLLML